MSAPETCTGSPSPQRSVRGGKSRTWQYPRSCPDTAWSCADSSWEPQHNPAASGWVGCTVQSVFSGQPWLSEYYRIHTQRHWGPTWQNYSLKAGMHFHFYINFFKYVRKTSLQIGRHSIHTKYIEILFHSYSQNVQLEGHVFTEITCCNQSPTNLLLTWAAPHLARWTINVTRNYADLNSLCVFTPVHIPLRCEEQNTGKEVLPFFFSLPLSVALFVSWLCEPIQLPSVLRRHRQLERPMLPEKASYYNLDYNTARGKDRT